MDSPSSSSASPPPSWAIFATIPLVCGADADLPPGADLSLALAAPPGISTLTVPPRVSPDSLTSHNYPSVLAADRSGLFLLHATQGDRTGPILRRDRFSSDNSVFSARHFVDAYFLCDARSATAYRLPDPADNRILDAGNLGLLTRDGGRTYLLAELQPLLASGIAILLRYSSDTRRWVSKVVDYPLGLVRRPWASHGVLSLGDRLWWYDVSWGLITCLPFEEEPELKFVPLPGGERLPLRSNRHDLQRHRCFAVSEGALRFLRIGVPATPKVTVERVMRMVRRHGERKDPWISSYTLCCHSESGLWSWRIHREVSFKEIWCHETYRASGLPKKAPKLGCVDPFNADIVYFFLDCFVFSVDLSSASLHKFARYKLKNPKRRYMSSRFVLPCETVAVPPAPGHSC